MKTKTLIILSSLLIYAGGLFAQSSNVVFFSDAGKKFTVILNGVKQNAKPETNVKITGLTQPAYKAKIIFTDPKLGSIDKNVYTQLGTEIVMRIKQNRKGDYVLRVQSQVALAQAPPTPANQTVVVYGTPPPPPPAPDNANTNTSTTVTTTTTNNATPNDNVNVGMNVGGMGVNMHVDAGQTGNANMTSATTTTTTTTTTTSGNMQPQGGYHADYHEHHEHYEHHGYDNDEHYEHHEHHAHYANGCYGPMPPADFASAKKSIANQSFSDGKLKVAKQVLNSNCMSSEQVKQVMGLFSFEKDKLAFAKYAYGHTTDPQNFYKLNDAFSFSSSVDELNSYIESHKNQ